MPHTVDLTQTSADPVPAAESFTDPLGVIAAPDASRIVSWLLTDARTLSGPGELLRSLSMRLQAEGMPVWRSTIHLPQLDPKIITAQYLWYDGAETVVERAFARRTKNSLAYHHSPVALMHRTNKCVRRRLRGPDADIDFPVLEELAADGATDYLLVPLPMGTAQPAGLSLATRSAAGFDPQHVSVIEAVASALSAVCEIHMRRLALPNLLAAYVGREASQHILQGRVTLTASRSIEAVILFSDMRNFTQVSETLPKDALLDLLNDYFAALVPGIVRAGGEVLKFLGDGLLAIFRLGDGEAQDEACARSLIASIDAQQAFLDVNARRRESGKLDFEAGIALHVGTVFYGNIGADDRLDFTVVGPAVNLASRIEKLTRELDRPILTSEAFAAASPVQLRPEGAHALKGLAAPQAVFSPMLE